ncbi:MAG TPA: HIRAN domain-containing protein [Bacteroidia bacterium]|nr:HIRAN domain-containing protein [Bacteroidia bacterium]
MKRAEFLKRLITLVGVSLIPLPGLTKSKKVWLLKFGIRGFQYYEGPNLIEKMQAGDRLELRREAENPFDKRAIAIYYQNQKIGFVPREKNEVLSRLMDSGSIKLVAEVLQLRDDVSWNEVYAGIYPEIEKKLFA